MDHFILQLQFTLSLIQRNVPMALYIVAGFWLIHICNVLLGHRLNMLGLYPRHILGIPGIVFAPFLHGNFNHLFFNSIPLFILVNFVLIGGVEKFIYVSVSIILLSGIATWFGGRRAIHIGASSLIMGYWGYLLANAYQNFSVMSVVLALICVYYLGGLFLNLFPTAEKVSWEGHVFGFLAGLATAFIGL